MPESGNKVVLVDSGHEGEVGCIVFHPEATLSLSDSACCLASCDRLGSVILWSLDRFLHLKSRLNYALYVMMIQCGL